MVFADLVALSDDAKASETTVVASLTTVAWIRCQKVHVDVVLVLPICFHRRKQYCYRHDQRANAVQSRHKAHCRRSIAIPLLPETFRLTTHFIRSAAISSRLVSHIGSWRQHHVQT
jgi:hypothetical protein